MGERVQLVLCKDCRDEYGYNPPNSTETIGGFRKPPYFFVKLEHLPKAKLLDHIESTRCPICDGENWELTDYTTF